MAQVRVSVHVDVDGDTREFTSAVETDGDGYRAARRATEALVGDVACWAIDRVSAVSTTGGSPIPTRRGVGG